MRLVNLSPADLMLSAHRAGLIRGFISRPRFAKRHFTHDFGYGPRVCVKESQLASIDDMPTAVSMMGNSERRLVNA